MMRQILHLLQQFFPQHKEHRAALAGKAYVSVLRRDAKARKIMTVLSEQWNMETTPKRILDIGSGNGEISLYLAQAGHDVTSCDIQPPQVDLSHFVLLMGAALPFEDSSFDAVVYNHVMEHLAQKSDQIVQLCEIHRVLNKEGCCYFAQPNRLFPFECHTGLWFLHWLPDSVWFGLIKKLGRYRENVYLNGYFKLKKLIRKAGFTYIEYTAGMIANPTAYSMEASDGVGRKKSANRMRAGRLLRILQALSPTNVFVLSKH